MSNPVPNNETRWSIDFRSMRIMIEMIRAAEKSSDPNTVSEIKRMKPTLVGSLKSLGVSNKLIALLNS